MIGRFALPVVLVLAALYLDQRHRTRFAEMQTDLDTARAALAECQLNRAARDMKDRINDELETLDDVDLWRRAGEWLREE